MILHNLKIAWRNIWKYKMQSLICIVGLAVGLTCFALCNYMLRRQMSRDHAIPYFDRSYQLVYKNAQGEPRCCRYSRIAQKLQQLFPEIGQVVTWVYLKGYSDGLFEVVRPDGNTVWFQEDLLCTDSSFFDFYKFRLLEGNWEQIRRQPDAIVLTVSEAQKIFGTVDVVGKTFVKINDSRGIRKSGRVYGVIADFPDNTEFEKYGGLELNSTCEVRNWNGAFFDSRVQLAEGVCYQELNQKIAAYLVREPFCPGGEALSLQLLPCEKIPDFVYKGDVYTWEVYFMIVGLLVLLTALFNYILFVTGRLLNRLKECGIRKVAGAGQPDIFSLFLTEAAVMIGLVVGVGLVLLEVMVPALSGMESFFSDLNLNILYLQLLQYGVGVFSVVAVICWFVTRRAGRTAMVENIGGSSGDKISVRNILLGIQLCVCLLFTGGTFFFREQLDYVKGQVAKGLTEQEKECIYSISLDGKKLEPIRTDFLNILDRNPFVEAYCRNGMELLAGWDISSENYSMEGMRKYGDSGMSYMYTDPVFPDFTKMKMVKGHFFTKEEPNGAVVNESAARLISGDPIGNEIILHDIDGKKKSFRIVGIMEDAAVLGCRQIAIPPCFYLPYPDRYMSLRCYVKLNAGMKLQVLQELEGELRKRVSPGTELYIENLSQKIAVYQQRDREMVLLSFVFSMVCIVISLLGIYSSMMLTVERRGKEVAVRKINGATLADIVRLFCQKYFVLLVAASSVAFPLLYFGVNSWLSGCALRITIGIFPFIGVFLLLAVIVGGTILTQLLKVVRIDPAEVLKRE